jgi:hypothetical protein
MRNTTNPLGSGRVMANRPTVRKLAVLMFRGDQAKNAELLVLRPKTCPERPDQQVRASRLTSEIANFTAQDPIFERHRFVVAGQGRVKS